MSNKIIEQMKTGEPDGIVLSNKRAIPNDRVDRSNSDDANRYVTTEYVIDHNRIDNPPPDKYIQFVPRIYLDGTHASAKQHWPLYTEALYKEDQEKYGTKIVYGCRIEEGGAIWVKNGQARYIPMEDRLAIRERRRRLSEAMRGNFAPNATGGELVKRDGQVISSRRVNSPPMDAPE